MSSSQERGGLHRSLSTFDGYVLSVCLIVGSGIFITPSIIFSTSGSIFLGFIAWAIAFVYSGCQAAVYAELSTRIPSAGGDYDYLVAAFGRRAGFAFTFTYFFVAKAGSQAILGRTFAAYVVRAIYQPVSTLAPGVCQVDQTFTITPSLSGVSVAVDDRVYTYTAIGCAVVLTLVCCLSVNVGQRVMLLLTVVKFAVIASIIGCAAAFAQREGWGVVLQSFERGWHRIDGTERPTVWRVASAVVACMWACDGWNGVTFVAEELKTPRKSLPKVLLGALLTVTVTFMLLNIAYLTAVPAPSLVSSPAIGLAAAASSLWCERGAVAATAALIGVGVLASQHASLMTGARYIYATARSRNAPYFLAYVSPFGTPVGSLVAQCVWVCLLLLSPIGSSLGSLIGYFGAASSAFYGLVGAAAIWLRWNDRRALRDAAALEGADFAHVEASTPSHIRVGPHHHGEVPELPLHGGGLGEEMDAAHAVAAWRTPLHPLLPLMLVGFAVCLVASLAVENFVATASAFGFVLSAIPVQVIGEFVASIKGVRGVLQAICLVAPDDDDFGLEGDDDNVRKGLAD